MLKKYIVQKKEIFVRWFEYDEFDNKEDAMALADELYNKTRGEYQVVEVIQRAKQW